MRRPVTVTTEPWREEEEYHQFDILTFPMCDTMLKNLCLIQATLSLSHPREFLFLCYLKLLQDIKGKVVQKLSGFTKIWIFCCNNLTLENIEIKWRTLMCLCFEHKLNMKSAGRLSTEETLTRATATDFTLLHHELVKVFSTQTQTKASWSVLHFLDLYKAGSSFLCSNRREEWSCIWLKPFQRDQCLLP